MITMKNDTDKIKKGQETHEEKTEEHEGHECECDHEKGVLAQKIEDLENSYKRALADYQNLQKRVAEERSDWLKIANRELLLRLLPILDTLMLARNHSQDQGLQVSVNQFLDVLKSEGVIRIETKDKEFDPLVMECVESKEGQEWKVLEEVKAGYRLGDIILRPALVIVGKKGDAETSSA